jgi:hypothetical protein
MQHPLTQLALELLHRRPDEAFDTIRRRGFKAHLTASLLEGFVQLLQTMRREEPLVTQPHPECIAVSHGRFTKS